MWVSWEDETTRPQHDRMSHPTPTVPHSSHCTTLLPLTHPPPTDIPSHLHTLFTVCTLLLLLTTSSHCTTLLLLYHSPPIANCSSLIMYYLLFVHQTSGCVFNCARCIYIAHLNVTDLHKIWSKLIHHF